MNGHSLFSEPNLERARECKLEAVRLIKDRGQGCRFLCAPWLAEVAHALRNADGTPVRPVLIITGDYTFT
jgi:hypothetical protein